MLKSFVSRLFFSAEVKTAEPVFLMHTIFSYSKTNSLTYLENRIFAAFYIEMRFNYILLVSKFVLMNR